MEVFFKSFKVKSGSYFFQSDFSNHCFVEQILLPFKKNKQTYIKKWSDISVLLAIHHLAVSSCNWSRYFRFSFKQSKLQDRRALPTFFQQITMWLKCSHHARHLLVQMGNQKGLKVQEKTHLQLLERRQEVKQLQTVIEGQVRILKESSQVTIHYQVTLLSCVN